MCLGKTKMELQQLYMVKVLTQIDGSTLAETNKSKAISSLIFLTEKLDGKIKARTCADRRKQRCHMIKEDVAALLSKEKRDGRKL